MKKLVKSNIFLISFIFILLLCVTKIYGYGSDQPCAARPITGNSVICVCNATYCDIITRQIPVCGTYVAYTSSEAGLRFKKSFGKVERYIKSQTCVSTLELNPNVLYQEISGFGGAVTDSAGINWKSLKDPRARLNLINSYFSKEGIEYSMLRVPIGGTDFSTYPYAYNELPPGDKYLANFTLSTEDYDLKIPLIQEAMKVATHPIRVIASMWSPPSWMKTSNSLTSGYLQSEYYQSLADYYVKFMESYENSKIPIWGITTSNEPLNAIFTNLNINRLQWTVNQMGQWIEGNLGPTIRNSSFKHVKIIAGDDQRSFIPLWFNVVIEDNIGALKYIDGVGVHFYFDKFVPATQLTKALEDYPDKFIIYTEASEGSSSDRKVILGSWSRAVDYASNIIEVKLSFDKQNVTSVKSRNEEHDTGGGFRMDLNHKVIGWLDWNLCLNETGGPTWINNYLDSPIIVSSKNQEFYKQPMFYALGHFSKFIPRGSRRMKVEENSCLANVANVAFLTPEKTIVVVMMNNGKKREILIKLGLDSARVSVEANSITTVEFPYLSQNVENC